jgi:hypothetical protein
MSFVEAARWVVVSTNRWPGLSTLYCRAYDVALDFTARRLGSVPGVLAVMLRTGHEGRAWVPGFSDYDLTVLAERCDGPTWIRFLDDLWTTYRSIKKVAPQLGEMEVMDLDEYGDFLELGPMPTGSLKRAEPLLVKSRHPAVERVLEQPPHPSRQREFLLDALSRFGLFALPAYLDDAYRGNTMTRRRAEHLLRNVTKRLAPLGVRGESEPNGSLTEHMVAVFRATSEGCRAIKYGGEPPAPVDRDVPPIPSETVDAVQGFCDEAMRRAGVTRCSATVWVPYLSANGLNLHLALPDDVAEADVRRLLPILAALKHTVQERLARLPTHSGAERYHATVFPSLASESMWKCWCELSPFDAVAIAANGRMLLDGRNDRLRAPSFGTLRRSAEVHYASLLPLKNNWRNSRGRPTGQYYAWLANRAAAYASAYNGRITTKPDAIAFRSAEDGYPGIVAALSAFRAKLVAERGMPLAAEPSHVP